MSTLARSTDQEPSLAPRLVHAVTFVPEPADAGPTMGVPLANGHPVVKGCPDCDDSAGD